MASLQQIKDSTCLMGKLMRTILWKRQTTEDDFVNKVSVYASRMMWEERKVPSFRSSWRDMYSNPEQKITWNKFQEMIMSVMDIQIVAVAVKLRWKDIYGNYKSKWYSTQDTLRFTDEEEDNANTSNTGEYVLATYYNLAENQPYEYEDGKGSPAINQSHLTARAVMSYLRHVDEFKTAIEAMPIEKRNDVVKTMTDIIIKGTSAVE